MESLLTSARDAAAKEKSEANDRLSEILHRTAPKICVVGTGGSGNNTLNRMWDVGIKSVDMFAMNTDAQHLAVTRANRRVLLGEDVTKGLGAGANPAIGEAAAKSSVEDIASAIDGYDMVFVACGLGGGTGTGSAHIIARVAKELGALTVATITLPFSVEGKRRTDNAMKGLKKLQKEADTVIVIPNDKLLEIAVDLPINVAFKVADEIITNACKGLSELIVLPGLVNLDFADVRTILSGGGAAMIGLGESSPSTDKTSNSAERAVEAVEKALSSPLIDVDVKDAKRALVNVTGGGDLTLREAKYVVEAVGERIHPDANIIWGSAINESLKKDTIQAMIVVAGAKMPFVTDSAPKKGKEQEIDIDFVGE